ncbi:c-type cytochrome [Hansschlegelia zhihuaiae]|uniref:C-type cytochrome n=1 Tax=Hansschlegelia zhihuaiae TaxID=405005 RepID=A0A4Q0MPL7_9HYPH|nr:c-type cytochrome [Hansschlegelia zhihuaiae]RXF75563.1 c-type cytochrome [Hansschlegelia zhihuaiae]
MTAAKRAHSILFAAVASLSVAGLAVAGAAWADPSGEQSAFTPPSGAEIPKGGFGEMVALGRDIFTDTSKHAGAFVGNDLNCSNCHLDKGRLAGAAPLWAAYVAYPAFRKKNQRVNTFEERLQGCFRYSMNGKAPPLGDTTLIALQAYAYWLAKGAPTGVDMNGRGYPAPKKPERLDLARGGEIYAQKCALCHGADGAGLKAADGSVAFPPLWGPRSYNWGAGMSVITNAAGFIKANMPLGLGGTLSDEDAWNVAAFVDSHERPQDPRFEGSVAETRKAHHDNPLDLYGTEIGGVTLGENSPPSGPQPK